MSNSESFLGSRQPQSGDTEFNAISFVAEQILNRATTATLVRVLTCTNAGGISPVGYVDVQPLVNQLDGFGNATPHGALHHLPYMRLQGGANAVILDPQPGDIGIAVFADHDISAVKASGAQANPGSLRRFDMADGLYIGGVLNGTPTQYIAFTSGGIVAVSPSNVTMTAPTVTINGNTIVNGTLTNNGVNVGSTHEHGGVTIGGGNTGAPL